MSIQEKFIKDIKAIIPEEFDAYSIECKDNDFKIHFSVNNNRTEEEKIKATRDAINKIKNENKQTNKNYKSPETSTDNKNFSIPKSQYQQEKEEIEKTIREYHELLNSIHNMMFQLNKTTEDRSQKENNYANESMRRHVNHLNKNLYPHMTQVKLSEDDIMDFIKLLIS